MKKRRHRQLPHPDDEPCYDCECCALWSAMLERVHQDAVRHVAGELRVEPCSPDCLICQTVATGGSPT